MFKYAGVLMFLVAGYLAAEGRIIWAVVLVILGLVILTTRYVTKINPDQKLYEEFISVIGMQLGKETTSFTVLTGIVITKANYSQTMNSRVNSTKRYFTKYTATLCHDQNQRLEMFSRTDKEELLKELAPYARSLGVGVEDRSL